MHITIIRDAGGKSNKKNHKGPLHGQIFIMHEAEDSAMLYMQKEGIVHVSDICS